MDTHTSLFEQTIIEEFKTKSVFKKVVSCWLGPIFCVLLPSLASLTAPPSLQRDAMACSKNLSHMDAHTSLFEQTIIEEFNTKSVFKKVVCCWLGPIFLCSCAKFGEFDSNSESPKRCNGVFKESSQWPPAVLKLIPTSSKKKKRNTILCHSIAKTNKKNSN